MRTKPVVVKWVLSADLKYSLYSKMDRASTPHRVKLHAAGCFGAGFTEMLNIVTGLRSAAALSRECYTHLLGTATGAWTVRLCRISEE